MRLRWLSIPAASLSIAFTSCKSTSATAGNNPSGTGPFDARGNYVEEWADSPSKWRSGSSQVVEAQPDRAPANVPVVPPTVLAANEKPKVISTTTITTVYQPKTKARPDSDESDRPKSKPTASSSSKPKPKAVVVKPKTTPKTAVVKAKPKSTRHTVKSGDNLYSIAKRYGTTAGALQRANGIKGAMIRPGQSLVIPK